jgi:DNA-binding response OmpR family regulator
MQELLSLYEVDVAATEAEACEYVRRRSFDLYVVAGGAQAAPALAFCEWLQRVDGRTPIVFCSSNASARYQQAAIAAGAVRCLVKPLEPAMLRSTVALLLKLAELESTRAMAAEQRVIDEELVERSREARKAASEARVKANEAIQRMLRAKAYRAFRAAGGNRANFERMWPALRDEIEARS